MQGKGTFPFCRQSSRKKSKEIIKDFNVARTSHFPVLTSEVHRFHNCTILHHQEKKEFDEIIFILKKNVEKNRENCLRKSGIFMHQIQP